MATKRKAGTKKDLEVKIAELEEKLTKLATQLEAKPPKPKPAETAPPKPAETKPAEPKPAETKPAEPKPAEVPKPAETKKQLPETFNEALEDAYYTAPMSDFHKYRATVTGYSPAPNRYYVRGTAPVGKVPTTDWNIQKAKVTGYTPVSNQYYATKKRMAAHPADKRFGSFSGVAMSVEGVTLQEKKPEPPKEAPKPKETTQTQSPPPSTTAQSKSRTKQLEEYENDYMKRLGQDKFEQQNAYEEELKKEEAETAAKAQTSASSSRGSLPKGFEAAPEPEKPKSSKGSLPKGF